MELERKPGEAKSIKNFVGKKGGSNSWEGKLSTGNSVILWSDLRALLRTGTLLPIHRVLQYINQSMEALTNYETSIQMIDGNGDIEFSITEENHDILEGFTVKARRKRLRTLKYTRLGL